MICSHWNCTTQALADSRYCSTHREQSATESATTDQVLTLDLSPFDPQPVCAKCGHRAFEYSYVPAGKVIVRDNGSTAMMASAKDADWLLRWCTTCGYAVGTYTLDTA